MTGVLMLLLATISIFTKNSFVSRALDFVPLTVASVATLWELEGSGAGVGALVSVDFGAGSAIVGEKKKKKGARIRVVGDAAIYLAFQTVLIQIYTLTQNTVGP